MSPQRTSPAWKPWRVKRESNITQHFRWVADAGPVDLTGFTIHLLIEWPGGEIALTSGVDAGLRILDQALAEELGFMAVDLTDQQHAELLLRQPAPRYEFQAEAEGLRQPIGEGQVTIDPGLFVHAG